MADNEDRNDDMDDDLPESLEELAALVENIEAEQRDIAATADEMKSLIGGASSPERVAILRMFEILQNSVMPILSTLANTTAVAVTDLFNEIDSGSDSMLLKEDADMISAALLGAAQIMAAYEAENSSEDVKQRCQSVGEAITKSLKRIQEITIEDDDKEEDEELN
jgi:hypothetical protein